MVWAVRAGLGLTILAYAVWLIWPAVQPLVAGATGATVVSSIVDEATRIGWAAVGLWLAASLLYLVAGGLTAGGVVAAPGAYFLAFAAEILLRLVLRDAAGANLSDVAARGSASLAGLRLAVDAAPLALGALLAVGLLVLMTGAWRGGNGRALTRDWTRPPVYA